MDAAVTIFSPRRAYLRKAYRFGYEAIDKHRTRKKRALVTGSGDSKSFLADAYLDYTRDKVYLAVGQKFVAFGPAWGLLVSPGLRGGEVKVELTYDHLAGKEMEIGRYYLTRKHYLSSVNRFKNVIDNFQTTTHVPEALHRLVESYVAWARA